MGLKVESCAKCTYGQPVPGQALVEVCRDPFPYSLLHNLTGQCLTQTAKMNVTGTKFEDQMQDTFLVNVNVTEEGTDVMVSKSAMVSFTNKAVYLLEGSNWPNKLLLNLTTNKNGRAAFSLNTANLKADLNLVASVKPEVFLWL
ncbi:ovostatin homolog [Pimephales promelas]|uniref:ovostatin homolog n=1 Tax=Pimephales promelas TaxID=90988 RepID=UPI001955EE23|nr:ovostatin homolog [Pimephales promelas]